MQQAKPGRPAILQYHGVPDTAHAWVSSTHETFTVCMKYLHAEKYTVIALRDLQKWVNPEICPVDPLAIIQRRKQRLQADEAI